jgi:hypothetical protein
MNETQHPAVTLPYASPSAEGGSGLAVWSLGSAVTAWALFGAAVVEELVGRSGDPTEINDFGVVALLLGSAFAVSALISGIRSLQQPTRSRRSTGVAISGLTLSSLWLTWMLVIVLG